MALLTPAFGQETVSPIESIGEVEILDSAAKSLIDPDAEIELLATGFEWSEGPVWVEEGGFVIFSDIPRNSIFQWSEDDGLKLYLRPAGYTGPGERGGESGSNGLAIDSQRRLVLCQHGDMRIARMDAPLTDPEAEYVTIVDRYDGKRFNSPNDLAIHSSGAIYFTDPPYGRLHGFEDPGRDLDFQGVYRVVPGESAQLLTDKLRAPNGIGFSPDERTLYVAQSDPNRPIYMAYNVQDGGTIDEGRVLFDAGELAEESQGSPDGLCIDKQGNLFATGPGGVLILSPEGKHLGTIRTGERIANCCFGNDGQTLYMTSDMHLCRVRLKTQGLRF